MADQDGFHRRYFVDGGGAGSSSSPPVNKPFALDPRLLNRPGVSLTESHARPASFPHQPNAHRSRMQDTTQVPSPSSVPYQSSQSQSTINRSAFGSIPGPSQQIPPATHSSASSSYSKLAFPNPTVQQSHSSPFPSFEPESENVGTMNGPLDLDEFDDIFTQSQWYDIMDTNLAPAMFDNPFDDSYLWMQSTEEMASLNESQRATAMPFTSGSISSPLAAYPSPPSITQSPTGPEPYFAPPPNQSRHSKSSTLSTQGFDSTQGLDNAQGLINTQGLVNAMASSKPQQPYFNERDLAELHITLPNGLVGPLYYYLSQDLGKLAEDVCRENKWPAEWAPSFERALIHDRDRHLALRASMQMNVAINSDPSAQGDDEEKHPRAVEPASPSVPKAKQRKPRKKKACVVPTLEAPFSEIAIRYNLRPRDVSELVNRPLSVRRQDAMDRMLKLHKLEWIDDRDATRPANAFILYRTAYSPVAKQYSAIRSEDSVSIQMSQSWQMEKQDVKEYFHDLARQEVVQHGLAFPNYGTYDTKHRAERMRLRDLVAQQASQSLAQRPGR